MLEGLAIVLDDADTDNSTFSKIESCDLYPSNLNEFTIRILRVQKRIIRPVGDLQNLVLRTQADIL